MLKTQQEGNNQILKRQVLNIHFTRDVQMANMQKRRCSTLLVTTEMQIKTTMKYHYIPIRMAKLKKTDHTKCL